MIQIKCNIKDLNFRVLVSGDKQARVVLDVVGEEELAKLSEFNKIPAGEQVTLSYGLVSEERE